MITVTWKNDRHIVLKTDRFGEDFPALSSFPGFSKWDGRSKIVRINTANIDHIFNNFREVDWSDCKDIIEDHKKAKLEAAKAIFEKSKIDTSDFAGDELIPYKRQPMSHQRKAIHLSKDKTNYALLMEQGTGKTKVTLDTACYLFKQDKIDMLIVVAWPNGVHRNWVDYEVPNDVSVKHVSGFWSPKHKTKWHTKVRNDILAAGPDTLKIYTFNVEAFTSQDAKAFMLRCLKKNRCMMVIDQSASIKNPSALRTKFLINECSKLAHYRRILDGAPIAEGADELYSQFKFLDQNIIGHDTWTGFRNEFCIMNRWNGVQGFRNMETLRARIDPHCYRVLADDCLDLPERIYKLWSFDLGQKEQGLYDSMKTRGLAEFDESEEGMLAEQLVIVKHLRLQQISCGWWPESKSHRQIEAEHPSRFGALLSLLEEAKGKAIIFSRFKADLLLLEKNLPNAVAYHGSVSEDDRAEAKRRFQEDEECLYFIGQPSTAGLGHTLTAAKHIIFYCNHPSLRLREECEKRAHRKGLKHKLFIWDIVARGTHDLKTINALRQKKSISNEILQDPDGFFLNHE